MPRGLKRTPIADRLWKRVDKTHAAGCWVWTGAVGHNGYGRITKDGERGVGVRVHRLSFELSFGPIPAGMLVCHHCDNRKCVNPHHLFIGTQKSNMEDCSKKGRVARVSGADSNMAKTLPANIAETVLDSRMSERALSSAIGISRNTIRAIRNGKHWSTMCEIGAGKK